MNHLEHIEKLDNLIDTAIEAGLYDAANALRERQRGIMRLHLLNSAIEERQVIRETREIKDEYIVFTFIYSDGSIELVKKRR